MNLQLRNRVLTALLRSNWRMPYRETTSFCDSDQRVSVCPIFVKFNTVVEQACVRKNRFDGSRALRKGANKIFSLFDTFFSWFRKKLYIWCVSHKFLK